MTIERLPHPGPRAIGGIVQNVVNAASKAKADRDALIKAHEHAAAFHEAMAGALEAEREIDSETAEFGHCDNYWTTQYRECVGKAAVALQNMPVVWAAVLNVELPKTKMAAE